MQVFNLDTVRKELVPILYTKQMNIGTKILVKITENGVPYRIENGTTFSVWYSGASGDGNYDKIGDKSAFSLDDNYVFVELIYQMLQNPGNGNMCIIMKDADGNQIGLWNIPYDVEAVPGANSEKAKDYYSILDAAQKGAEEARNLSQLYASDAHGFASDAESFAAKAEEARNLAMRYSEDSYTFAQDAESFAIRAETAGSPVSYLPQNLSPAEKTQARENIGAMADGIQKSLAINSTDDTKADVVLETELRKSGTAAMVFYSGDSAVGAEHPTVLGGLANGEYDDDAATVGQVKEMLEEAGGGSSDNSPVRYIKSTADNPVSLRSLEESGTYLLEGVFAYYDGGPTVTFSPVKHVQIDRFDDRSEIQCFIPNGNRVNHLCVTDEGYTFKSINLSELESTANRVSSIDSTSDDEHYPTAKAVREYVWQNGGSVSHCWQGKKVVFLGDSIAQGYTDKGNVSTPYPKVVADNLGMTLTNYGIGGSTVAQQENYGGAFKTQAEFEAAEKDTSKIYQVITGQGKKTYEYDSTTGTWVNSSVNVRTPLSARWSFMRDDADLVIVQSGTNDFQYDWTPVGTMADRTPYTFYGALHTLFIGLLEKYKGKTIVFLTSLKRSQTPYTTPESQNSYGLTLSDYRDIMLEVCDYYGVPVIDVFSVSGLNPYLDSQADIFDNAKTHPLQWGHNRLGDIVSTRLLCVQRFNSADYEPSEPEPDEPTPDEPTTVAWYENKALKSGSVELSDMNYRTTCDFVAVPESGLTITLTDDDIEMCVYTYTVNKTQSSGMSSYLAERTYSVDYNETNARYVRVMVRSKSSPNGKLITAELATAGVQFTAT